MKHHTYSVEVQDEAGRWSALLGLARETCGYAEGYVKAVGDCPGPRLAFRVVRDDGKVIREAPAKAEVSIGMVAGFPSAEQYEAAAERALERARLIRMPKNRNEQYPLWCIDRGQRGSVEDAHRYRGPYDTRAEVDEIIADEYGHEDSDQVTARRCRRISPVGFIYADEVVAACGEDAEDGDDHFRQRHWADWDELLSKVAHPEQINAAFAAFLEEHVEMLVYVCEGDEDSEEPEDRFVYGAPEADSHPKGTP